MKTFSNKPVSVMAMMTVMSMWMVACEPSKPAKYTTDLQACNQLAKTCEESIACENKNREANGRPLRDPKKGCN